MKLKDLFNRAINKNTKQVSYCLKKRKLNNSGININKLMEMEIKDNKEFLS